MIGDKIERRAQGNDLNEITDLRKYVGLFISNWYWFAISFFTAGILTYFINSYSERAYTVRASLLIKDEKAGGSPMESLIPGGDLFRSMQNLQNEIGILKSFSINRRVIANLPEFHVSYIGVGRRGIAENRHYMTAPIIMEYDSLHHQRFGVPITIRIRSELSFQLLINAGEGISREIKFGERFSEGGFDFVVRLRNQDTFRYDPGHSNRYIVTFNRPESLANQYRSKLSVTPYDKESSLIFLTVSGPVAQQEADYLNMLMTIYLRDGQENKNLTAENSIRFIDEQLVLISDSLERAGKNLEEFRNQSRLFNLSSEGNAILNRMEQYENERVAIRIEQQYYDYLGQYLNQRNQSGDIISPSFVGIDDPIMINLISNYSVLLKQRNLMLFNFNSDNPAIILLDGQIEEAKANLEENVKNSVDRLMRILIDVDGRMSEVEKELSKLPGTERRLLNFQREYDLNNTIYTYMLEKRAEAAIALASDVPSNRVIDQATSFNSSRIRPREKRNFVLALFFAMLIPGAYILLIDFFNDKVMDSNDIINLTGIPIIGYIGHNDNKTEVPVYVNPGSSLSESFRSLRTNLKYYLNEGKKVINITSTISSEGKTFVSTNVAASLALLGKKVILIGLDMRKPRIHKLFDHKLNIGLSNYLIGDSGFDDIIAKTGIENLEIITSGPVPPNPAELIETERMADLFTYLRQNYDYIILDTPPVGIVTDGLLLIEYSDLTLFVVRQRYSSRSTIEFIQSLYDTGKYGSMAIVTNDINVYGYYGYGLRYGAGLYKGYGYNYGYGQYGAYVYDTKNSYYRNNDV